MPVIIKHNRAESLDSGKLNISKGKHKFVIEVIEGEVVVDWFKLK